MRRAIRAVRPASCGSVGTPTVSTVTASSTRMVKLELKSTGTHNDDSKRDEVQRRGALSAGRLTGHAAIVAVHFAVHFGIPVAGTSGHGVGGGACLTDRRARTGGPGAGMAGAAGPCAAGAEVAAAGSGVGAAAVIAAAPSARAVCAVSTGGERETQRRQRRGGRSSGHVASSGERSGRLMAFGWRVLALRGVSRTVGAAVSWAARPMTQCATRHS